MRTQVFPPPLFLITPFPYSALHLWIDHYHWSFQGPLTSLFWGAFPEPLPPRTQPHLVPFLEVLDHHGGVFVIALITLYDMEVSSFLDICLPTSL